MLVKFFFYIIFSLISVGAFAQKPAKSSKELSKRLIAALQAKDKDALQSLFAPPATYKVFAPHLKQNSDTEIADMLKNDKNSLENKFDKLLRNLEKFGISASEIQWKSIAEKPLNAVVTDYLGFSVIVSYQNTSDTILIETFKEKKKWYLIDIASAKPFYNIICKHARYSSQQYYDMAVNQIQEQKYDEALENLENAEYFSKNDADIFFQKGKVFKGKNNIPKALEMFRRAYQIDQDYMPAYYEAAIISYEDQDYEALYNLELCVEREYEVFNASKYLFKIYQKHLKELEQNSFTTDLKNQHEKILTTTSRILEKENELNNEEKMTIYLFRANSLIALSNYKEARSQYEKLLLLEPNNITALYELSWLENELENYPKALAYAKKAYELDKNDGEILSELAFAKMKTQDFKGAINDYNTLFAMGREFQTAKKYQNRGDCYKALKNNKMACADYKKAVEFGADDGTMKEWIKKNCK